MSDLGSIVGQCSVAACPFAFRGEDADGGLESIYFNPRGISSVANVPDHNGGGPGWVTHRSSPKTCWDQCIADGDVRVED